MGGQARFEVVVADGSELVRRALLSLLEPRYVVYVAGDGQEALAHFERHPDATLITALKMTPMDGRTLLQNIERRWPERLEKVVVLTGWPDPHRWVPSGVIVMSKPVRPELVLAVLAARVAIPTPRPLEEGRGRTATRPASAAPCDGQSPR